MSKRTGFRITTVQALLFVYVCLLMATQAPLHVLDLSDPHHGSHAPLTPLHEHPMLLVVSGILIVFGALLIRSCRVAALFPVRNVVHAPAVARCDVDVGLHLLLSSLRI
ncbi:MAG: hypothetical protein M3542_06850 [Acidobacteriota bacterium]|nr:hypothetical protein [Acidobacteriota bacterium]MDQ5870987.1 hypothetical protein [Acidobacteriota bacterium]